MNQAPDFPPRGNHPTIRPKDAATLVLFDLSGGRPRVLMGRRSKALAFMPGLYVFPGGRLDRADHHAPRSASLHEADMRRLVSGMGAKGSARRAEALALAAIRETWEETGLFIAADTAPPAAGANGEWRGFVESGYTPNLAALRYVGRAITPPGRNRRFDTRFFAALADCVANPDGLIANPREELEDVLWVPLEDMESLPVPRITEVMLKGFRERLKADPGLTADLPVPCHAFRHGRHVQTFE